MTGLIATILGILDCENAVAILITNLSIVASTAMIFTLVQKVKKDKVSYQASASLVLACSVLVTVLFGGLAIAFAIVTEHEGAVVD